MDKDFQYNLKQTSLSVREMIIEMACNGGCFIGASLSAADIISYLYESVLNLECWENRDFFLLSKGHDVPALYGILAIKKIIDPKRIYNHMSTDDDIYWHPNTNIKGIEYYSGSLGHLASVSVGIAIDFKHRNSKQRYTSCLEMGNLMRALIGKLLANAKSNNLSNLIYNRSQFLSG